MVLVTEDWKLNPTVLECKKLRLGQQTHTPKQTFKKLRESYNKVLTIGQMQKRSPAPTRLVEYARRERLPEGSDTFGKADSSQINEQVKPPGVGLLGKGTSITNDGDNTGYAWENPRKFNHWLRKHLKVKLRVRQKPTNLFI